MSLEEDFMEGVSVSSGDSAPTQGAPLTVDLTMDDEDMKVSPTEEVIELGQGSGSGSALVEPDFKKPPLSRKRQPGSGWNDTEAREEYDRAMKTVLDRHFSMNKYGDPILDVMNAKNVKRY